MTKSISQVSSISNKSKRHQVYAKLKKQAKTERARIRRRNARETAELGEEAPLRPVPRTIDNTRQVDETIVRPEDDEVFNDEVEDEFCRYFAGEQNPKIMITTRPRPSGQLFDFVQDLMQLIPSSFFYSRRSFEIKDICHQASKAGFTHLIVLSEKSKKCNGMLLVHLPIGPTAFWRVSNVITRTDIPNHGRPTSHTPELILNNFDTRLGHRVGRFVGSLFPHKPQFRGRQVVSFHNQRDFIFVRHHRYIFDQRETDATSKADVRARLQELSPRFTLKLKWLQEGKFDTQYGEFEWVHRRHETDNSRKTFHL